MNDVKYLQHPCSVAEKEKWNKKGFKVLDVKFKPAKKQEQKKD